MLAFLLHKNREFLLTYPEKKISSTIYKKFKQLEEKRLNHWPIAYLLGHKEFYGLDFIVNQQVLTPRPETELIIDQVLELITIKKPDIIIDVGTGSGAIIITLAQKIKPRISFLATDISTSALKIANQNARHHRVDKKIKFYQGNLLTPIIDKLSGRDLLITANLPYLTPKQIKNSPSIQWEPLLALNGGPNGLRYYYELFQQLNKVSYQSLTLLCEIDSTQKLEIKKLAQKYFSGCFLEIKKDLAGKDRLLILKN